MGLIPYINDFDIVVVFIPIIVIVHAEFLLPFFLVAQGRIQTGLQTQDGKQVVHIVRHRRFKGNGFAGFRMYKAQVVGMQGLARTGVGAMRGTVATLRAPTIVAAMIFFSFIRFLLYILSIRG